MIITDDAEHWSRYTVGNLLAQLLPGWPQVAALSVVGVNGRSRAGKSTVAARIAAAAENVAVVHTDDIAWHHSFFEWSDDLIANVLRPLRQSGPPVSFIPAAWTQRGRPGAIAVPADTRIVLVEGVGATRIEMQPWLDSSIWVETDPTEAMRRTIALDRDPPGFVDEWMRAEQAHLSGDRPWARAAAWVSGQHPLGEIVYARINDRPSVTATSDDGLSRTFHVDGLLFDNDGVLVDSHNAAAAAWNQWAVRWAPGFDFRRDIQHGIRLADVVAQLVSPREVAEATRELLDMEIRMTAKVAPIPGARELTSQCPPRSWAVVTSGVRAIAEARLASADIAQPSAVITAEDIARGKPAPDPYLAGASALKLHPRQCAVFEDAAAGITSARAAGVRYVIGVGKATLSADIDVAISDLSGITFDGRRLTVPAEVILARS